MKRILYVLLIMLIMKINIQAQSVNAPQIQSPNVSSLGEYGKVPVSYYTGVPDISIPIYTVKTGNLNLPISLSYHPESVKPNEHPGWVGLGWTLNSYGVISRVMHGEVDEGNYSLSYIYDGGDASVNGAVIPWDTDEFVRRSFFYSADRKEVQADEFYFNFQGHSGKFMYSNGKWQVFSQENIKVICDPIVDGYVENTGQILSNCTNGFSAARLTQSGYPGGMYRFNHFFRRFSLITEDGTKYDFGGADNSIEFTTSYDSELGTYLNARSQIMASAWHLTKITDVNNNEINFSYTRTDYPVCALGYYYNYANTVCVFPWSSAGSFTSGYTGTHLHGGSVIFPVYLNQISTSNETLTFNINPSVEKQYPDRYLFYSNDNDINNTNNHYQFYWLPHYLSNGTGPDLTASQKDILWMQLYSININSKTSENYKNFIFSYDNSATERLRLSSVKETDKNNVTGASYSFQYDNSQLPDYGGDQTDHWGFYNGQPIDLASSEADFFSRKQTDINKVKAGLLTKIIFPTGGRTEFTWESNSYSKVVAANRQSLTDYNDPNVALNGYGGGVRIWKIESFENATSTIPLSSKTYYYVLNYAGDNINNYTISNSSGILNGAPKYSIPDLDRPTLGGEGHCQGSFFFTNGLSSYGYNANGYPLGYSEVTEMNKDGSYIRYLYTNYVDNDGARHYDQTANHVTGWANGDVYAPSTSLQCERGKLLNELNYNTSNKLVKEIKYAYTTDNNRFNKYVKRILSTFGQISTVDYDALIFTASFKDYYYRYNLMSKIQSIYDPNGNNGVITTENYTYNDYDQMKSVTQTQSDGSVLTTDYKYSIDYSPPYSENTIIKQLVGKNILNAEIEKISSITKGTSKYIVGAQYTKYGLFNNNIKPQTVYSLNSATPVLYSSYNGWNIPPISTSSLVLYTTNSTNPSPQSTSLVLNSSNFIVFNPSTLGYNSNDSYSSMTLQIDNLYSYQATNGTNASVPQFSLTNPKTYTFTLTYHSSTNSSYGGSWNASYAVYSSNSNISVNSALKPEITFDYDDYGNIIDIQKTNNINTSYIWGYNNTLPVAKFDNITYSAISSNSTLMNYVNQLQNYTDLTDPAVRSNLKTLNGNIRSNVPADVIMTTYTYSPLVGMTSQTDPNGITTYYEYDTLGRLKNVKDKDLNLLKYSQYHYQTQP